MVSYRTYKGDPRWLNARYPGTCRGCEQPIERGDRAWYYPKGRHIYCEPCGEPKAAEFAEAAMAEDMYGGGMGW